jgi:hypothetical protein
LTRRRSALALAALTTAGVAGWTERSKHVRSPDEPCAGGKRRFRR